MKKGFTLIELLVVIAIIGSLAALLVPNFMSARERARDAQRKSDLRQIQKALELYKLDQTQAIYPTPAGSGSYFYLSSSGIGWSGSNASVYMNKVPVDPNKIVNPNYYYKSPKNGSTDNGTYDLCACLENSADPDPNDSACSSSVCSTYCGTTPVKCYVVNEP